MLIERWVCEGSLSMNETMQAQYEHTIVCEFLQCFSGRKVNICRNELDEGCTFQYESDIEAKTE